MFGGLPEWVFNLLTMLLMGWTIKLLDDHLDSEYDIARGERTLAVRLGRSAFAYGMVSALLAAALNQSLAIALFFSSYAVGMFTDVREKQPTHLPAYVECAIAVGLSVLFAGWQTALFALAFVALVDWLDDIVDYGRDALSGERNVARSLGFVETTLLVLLALLTAVLMQPLTTILGFVAFALITAVSELSTERLWHTATDCDGGAVDDNLPAIKSGGDKG
ncbi:hypothetical protein JZ785_07495 [Alicyclobacillus curvatus]|nr:hypothetical protein JZ785_07495 [Alicyclobacillus curvatus]